MVISERITDTAAMLLGLLLGDTWGNFRHAEGGSGNAEISLAGLVCCFKALTPCLRGLVVLPNALVSSFSTFLT